MTRMTFPGLNLYARRLALALAIAPVALAIGQQRPAAPAKSQPTASLATSDQGDTQEKLLALLRVSPVLARVVADDPSLIANQDYIARYNPELAQFLQDHPEVGRNPQFYLFSDLRDQGHRNYQLLAPKLGFDPPREPHEHPLLHFVTDGVGPFLVMVCVGGALLWLIRLLLQNRRWGKIFNMQSTVHGQLIDKFGSSQELITYMQTDAGRRFLEAAPIATEFDQKRLPNVVSRVLTSLQIGVVLSMMGTGLILLRHGVTMVSDARVIFLVLGVVLLMPGLGFILSAGVTWMLAKRLGLMPDASELPSELKARQ